jgi:hypothetical protein
MEVTIVVTTLVVLLFTKATFAISVPLSDMAAQTGPLKNIATVKK